MSHILIADDDQFLTKVCSSSFEQAGYRISTANDGHRAVELLVDEKPDLVLLDLMLPGIDGIGILKFIRSRDDLENLPVFILSNSTYFSGIVQSARDEGATKFIRKGEFSPKGLVDEIRKSLPPGQEPSPAGQDSADSQTATPKAASKRSGTDGPLKTALVADDDRTIHSVLTYFLNKAGYQIESAFNGLQALEMARQEAPDLLILDFIMPVKNGFQTLAEWVEDPALKDIPVIMLTSCASEENESRALSGGATHFLAKPFSPESLIGLADEVTEGVSS